MTDWQWQRAPRPSTHDFRLGRRLGWLMLSSARPLRPWLLRRALQQSPRPCALPADWLVAPGDAALSLRLPTSRLHDRLYDWLQLPGRRVHASDHFLLAGDWSAVTRPIADSRVYAEVTDLMACGAHFRDSPTYAAYRRALEKGRVVVRAHQPLDSVAAIDAYYRRCLALLDSLRTEGFRDRRQWLAATPRRAGFSAWRSRWWDWQDHDLAVAINRDGSVLRLPGGQHRTAMALQLGLPSVPVVVRVVHPDWLRARMLLCSEGYQLSPWSAMAFSLRQMVGDVTE